MAEQQEYDFLTLKNTVFMSQHSYYERFLLASISDVSGPATQLLLALICSKFNHAMPHEELQ